MSSFFSQLSYSFGNEDWATEQQALQIKPRDTVLVITASGDRPLNLLTNDCKEVISIDANQQQNNLLELKVVAMQNLSFDKYLAFLGADPSDSRAETFKSLSSKMNPEAIKFWSKNHKLVSKGVLYQGSVERLTYHASKLIRLFRAKKIEQLFAFDNIEEQRKFVRDQWDTSAWKKFVEFMLNPIVNKFLIDDPGLQTYLGPQKPGIYIYQKMQNSLENHLAKQNTIMSFILLGKVNKEAFAPYLTKEGTSEIKKRLDKLTIKTGNVIDYLEAKKNPSIDCFSMSDIASYMSKEDFRRLLKGIIKKAKPGARFCLRQFLSYLEIPKDLERYFKRDYELEQRLEKEDRCFVYRFFSGTVV